MLRRGSTPRPLMKVILVDVMNLVFRSHFVHKNLTHEGHPTGVLYGCLKKVLEFQTKVSRNIVFCWDHGVPVLGAPRPYNWRQGLIKDYKATRHHDPEMWQQVVQQLPPLFKALVWLGYSSVSVMGLEADDIIGILSHEIPQEITNTLGDKKEVLIFSSDRDCYQLLNPRVQIIGQHERQYITAEYVEKFHGVPISRWAEYLALGGDSSDNIKPMRGMGPKTAAYLLTSGVDLNKPFTKQPPAFCAKYGPVWDRIQQAYQVARLPQSWTDKRITSNILGPPPRYAISQTWNNPTERSKAWELFTQFCADNSLVTLLASRRQLFGESNCLPEENFKPLPEAPLHAAPRPLSSRRII